MYSSSDIDQHGEDDMPVETMYKGVLSSSSEEPPMEEWSSLLNVDKPVDSPKMAMYKHGLYDPGSGDVCAKYIAISDSRILRHVYYDFPAVRDPGVMKALLKPEPKNIYGLDGREMYLDLCKEMSVIPVRIFVRNLTEEVIDLKHYCVNPVGVRAMCMALANNKFVKRLDLTGNYLSLDACYHIGWLLGETFCLQELVLSQCRIGNEELRRIVNFLANRNIDLLDLSKNEIQDSGFQYLADHMMKGARIKRLNLSFNKLGLGASLALAETLQSSDCITHLDLSWNQLFSPKGSNELLRTLGASKVLSELNMAWNSLTNGAVFNTLLQAPKLAVLDFSNNKLSTEAVTSICQKLKIAKKLQILDLSRNPIKPKDALALLRMMKEKSVNLNQLVMDNVAVDKTFVEEYKELKLLPRGAAKTIIFGRVIKDCSVPPTDMKVIVMKRLVFLNSGTKKSKFDICVYFLQITQDRTFMEPKDMLRELQMASANVNDSLITALADCFPGPKTGKMKLINLQDVADYVRRLWPDKKLPPPEPPVPPPQAPIIPAKGEGSAGKKKK